jgi:hypothetical protein
MQGQGSLDVGVEAKELVQFTLDAYQTQQRCLAADRVDQYVNITDLCVVAAQNRSKHPWVAGPIGQDNSPDGITMQLQGF